MHPGMDRLFPAFLNFWAGMLYLYGGSWEHVCCGTPEQGKVLQNPVWKGDICPKDSASDELDGHFGGTDHNWIAPKSYLAVVAKEDVEDSEDEAVHRLRNSFLELLGTAGELKPGCEFEALS